MRKNLKAPLTDWDPYQHLMALESSARVAEANIEALASAHNTQQDQIQELQQLSSLLKDCIVALRQDQHKIEKLYLELKQKNDQY